MSTSTNGQICYGILTKDGQEFPWDGEEHEGNIESWWRDVSGTYMPPADPYDENGKRIHSVSNKDFDAYWDYRIAFDKTVPIALVNVCSMDYPMYILAVPESVKEARRGSPEKLDLKSLSVTESQKQFLLDFCEKYGIPHGEPGWYLSSYWG